MKRLKIIHELFFYITTTMANSSKHVTKKHVKNIEKQHIDKYHEII